MKLSRGAHELLAHLRSYGPNIFPKQETLAAKLDLSLRTINGRIAELKRAGLISVEQRGPSSSIYKLIIQRVPEEICVASAIVENSPKTEEIPVEKQRICVASCVPFCVASPPDLLMRGLSSFVLTERKLVAGDDGFVPNPKNPNPGTPSLDGLESRPREFVSRSASERQEAGECVSLGGGGRDPVTCRSLAGSCGSDGGIFDQLDRCAEIVGDDPPKINRKPPGPDAGWSRSMAESVARLASRKALGSGP